MIAETSRRRVLAGAVAAPLLTLPPIDGGTGSPAPDPHIALAEEAVARWHRHKASAWGWDHHDSTPEAQAATRDHLNLLDHCIAATELLPPSTLPGLGALALMMALATEHGWSVEESESMKEGGALRLLEAVLTCSGVTMPDGFDGLVFRPEDDASEGGVA